MVTHNLYLIAKIEALNIEEGFLAVIAVEHDHSSIDVPRIEKGTNGRAMV